MLQANDIPPFSGEESCEVAEKWLEIFVSSTGSFSSSGIFRLIYRKFPLGSSAREWFDSLDGSATDSWKIFESKFCDKWVTKHDQKAWNDFIHHFLEDDSIFGDGADCEASIGVIRVWVEEHRRLGRVTGCENQMLIQATMKILPPFIQAYIQAFISIRHHSFDNLCDDIKGVTPQVLEFERTRRSIDIVDRVSVMERRIKEISEKVEQVFKVVCQSGHTSQPFGFNTTKSQSVTADSLSAESIDWEQCSSLTSINSEGQPGESPSVLATPTLKTNSLIQGKCEKLFHQRSPKLSYRCRLCSNI
ncbi:hypothetical protein FRC03_006010 [Tulasnella sp. 419]|nr:hypothetical protein FRC03_006010 [Tulasnella sp. 419]